MRFEPNKTGQSFSTQEKQSLRIYDKIVVSTLICDFGNVVVNSVKKKTVKLFNTGTLPADIVFDAKAYKQQAYTITPEKIMKLPPDGAASIVISYQAKKNSKFGLNVTQVPLEVKNGPKYTLELRANVTIPEITVESNQPLASDQSFSMSADTIDFQNVVIGQRKTVFIRFVNYKEITCEWSLLSRASEMQGIDKGAEQRYSIFPQSGVIQPGQKQLVKLSFTPN